MAKIVVNMDTEAKTMSLSVDGKDVPGVCYISMCSERDEYSPMHFTAEIDESEEDSDVKVRKTIMASEGKIQKFTKEDPSVIAGIASLFMRK